MWKLHEIKDDWGVGWQVETVTGKDADGGDILASVPHTFTDYQTAERVRHRLNEGESICCWCDNFKHGSCVLNCEEECEEEYFGAFEHSEKEALSAGHATIDRNGAGSAQDAQSDKLTVEKKDANTERFRTFSKVLDFGRYDLVMTGILMLIALTVFVGLAYKVNMWLVICLYWAVLSVRNLSALMSIVYKKEGRR